MVNKDVRESVYCKECENLCRVPFIVLDACGGDYYCEDCRTEEWEEGMRNAL